MFYSSLYLGCITKAFIHYLGLGLVKSSFVTAATGIYRPEPRKSAKAQSVRPAVVGVDQDSDAQFSSGLPILLCKTMRLA
jgi:hypothetical protein